MAKSGPEGLFPLQKMQASAPQQGAELDAKLHQGYDANTEFQQQGHLHSSVPFGAQHKDAPAYQADPANGLARFLAKELFAAGLVAAPEPTLADGINTKENASNPAAAGVANDASESASAFGDVTSAPASASADASALPIPTVTAETSSIAETGGQESEHAHAPHNNTVSSGETTPVPIPPSTGETDSQSPTVDPTPQLPTVDPTPQPPTVDPNPQPPTVDPNPQPVLLVAPTISVTGLTGAENQPLPLSIGLDTQMGAQTVLTVTGVPDGAILSAGMHNNDGTWTLNPSQLSGLTLQLPDYQSGTFTLSITAVSSDGTATASATVSLPIDIEGVATAPNLSTQPASGGEDTAIALNINASLVDTDGSESLSILISGAPSGATLSAGIDNNDGTWTLNSAQLSGLTLTPPANWSGTINLAVTAITNENSTTAFTSASLPVTVTGIADVPTLFVQPATGNEDSAIALDINAALTDTDGSENLIVTIGGVPPGALLSAGTNNHDGTWTLNPTQLSGLTLTPSLHSGSSFDLTITATSSEAGTSASTIATLPVTVAGIASIPNLAVQAASGTEDTAIPLAINAALTDTDGSEVLSITVSGVPAGAILSAGTNNNDGSWTLTPQQLGGLTFTPPLHAAGTFNLTVIATSSENGSNAAASAPLVVTVAGDASTPNLSVAPASGIEDTPIALNISAALTDTDGSETLAVTLSGVPGGATLSAGTNNHDGTWTLTPPQLSGLAITPPVNFSGTITLGITATSSENGTTASTSASLPVVIAGAADTPALAVQAATGVEDTAIALSISAALTDTDGSESLGVVISGVPAGAILSAGTNNNGSWTLTPQQLGGLTFTPPAHASGTYTLTVTAIASENGTTSAASAPLAVTVAGAASTPSLNLSPAAGIEDTAIALNINAALNDTDGSEVLSITVSGVPAGASLSAGTNTGNGTWTLAPGQLSGLTFTPPLHASGTFNLTVTAISSENGTSASAAAPLAVVVAGEATAPALSVVAASGIEDTAIALNIAAALVDTDGSETLSITISGVPNGASLSAGTDNHNGTWTLNSAQLSGLMLTPPAHTSGTINLTVAATSSENGTSAVTTASLPVLVAGVASVPSLVVQPALGLEDTAIALNVGAALNDTDGSETLSVTISGVPAGATLSAGIHNNDGTWSLMPQQLSGLTLTPPLHYSGTLNLMVTATSAENSTFAHAMAGLDVTVAGVATTPALTLAPAAGLEDVAVPLSITAALNDTDGSEVLSITVSGVPAGATLSAGVNNNDGSWTLAPADLSGLTLTPPQHMSGYFTLHVTATSAENNTTASVSADLPVLITDSATPPGLGVFPAIGNEDTGIALTINAALNGTSSTETLSITIADIPTGAVLSAGTNNHDGTWTLTPQQLTGLTFTPPVHASGGFLLHVTATFTDNGVSTDIAADLPVVVAGVATTPSLSLAAASGNEDSAIALNINAALVDTDGSETLSVTVSGVPTGATLSAGTNNGNGTWTLTQGQLSGLTLTPPVHASGNYNLTVTATSSENGTTASASANLPVAVAGVATTPNLAVQAAAGNEDSGIALNITTSLADPDSETLSVLISNVPANATLSAGTNNHDGTWTLSPVQLSGLILTPPHDFSGTINLGVTATSTENGTSAAASATLPVVVAGVADAPTLQVMSAVGLEDAPIVLNITAALADTDGSESLSVIISGVPSGASLSAGTHNNDGTWTLTSGQLSGLTLTPSLHASGAFNLAVTAISSENGTTASTSVTLPVTVAGVATAPVLNTAAATGNEDSAIALNISAALADTDGSETLSITIGSVPTGATLSAGTNNHDGTWTLTPGQLSGLSFTPPLHASGSFGLTVSATSSENGTTSTVSSPLGVTVAGIATTPSLAIQAAAGNEDTAIALNINAALVDTDGSETLAIIIGSIPTGATLSAGTNNHDGTWTLTPQQLSGLTFTPPVHASGLYTLSVTATSSESGTSASAVSSLPVTIAGVATTPAVSAAAAAGNEDQPVALNISAALADTDGSETLSVTISGVPAGAILSAGTNNNNGTWTLTPGQLSGLSLTPPLHSSGNFNLTVTATSSENGSTATASTLLSVAIAGVATAPSLNVQAVSGNEDSPIALNIGAALVDTDGSETLSVTVSGVPSGATLSAGTNNHDGTWTLNSGQLSGLTLTPPANFSGTINLGVTATSAENGTTASTSASLAVTVAGVADAPTLSVQAASGNEDGAIALHINAALVDTDGSESLSIVLSNVPSGAVLSAGTNNNNGTWTLSPGQLSGLTLTPPANFSGTINLGVTATSSENGTTASTSTPLVVTVAGVADAPTLSVQAASGNEDGAIALHINAALTDTDGSETLSMTISGVPSGAMLSAGTNNNNGTWTLTPGQLSGLALTPPTNFSGTINLSVTATSSENGTTASTSASLAVSVAGIADAPTLSVQAASGSEDSAIALHISPALTDTDGSETLSVTISGVPSGAVLSAGTNNNNGTWTLTAGQLSGLAITPPANFSGTINLGITAASSENGTTASTSASLAVAVAGVADAPSLSVQAASGNEDGAIALSINTALTDTDGSETLSVTISGVPAGAVLSAGTNNNNGTWTLTPGQLSGLTLTPAHNFSGTINLGVTATSAENGTTASTSASLAVSVAGVADAPTGSVQTAIGNEDSPIALHINPALTDTDGSETLSITISGVPSGATLSAGTNNGSGSWTLTPLQLSNLTLTPPTNFSGTFALAVTATSSENATTASVIATLPVIVHGVADAPSLSVQAASGNEDGAIALSITTARADTDGSETLSVMVSGVPDGAQLSAGLYAGNGRWSLTPAQLSGLTLTPPHDFAGTINLSVTAVTIEQDGSSTHVSAPLNVTVAPQADTPALTVVAAAGREDSAISLNITSALTDSSESLSINISGVPTGATLSAGTNNGSGSWTLTPAQLAGLKITPPANSDADFTLSVTATSTDGASQATQSASFSVTVLGAADTPTVSASNASAAVNTQVPITISGAVTDTDGSESITYQIGGVPDGFALTTGTNNGDNTWTLTPAQLSGLALVSPYNFQGRVYLTATAVAHDSDGDTARSSSAAFNLGVGNASGGIQLNLASGLGVAGIGAGVAAGTTVNAGGLLSAGGIVVREDTSIPLPDATNLLSLSAGITQLTFTGIPSGASLSAGTRNPDGTYTLLPSQLTGLSLFSAPNSDQDFTIGISARATVPLVGTVTLALASTVVHVVGVADAPTLSVANATGNEDSTGIAISITGALTDTDGSETLSYMIKDLPSGFIPTVGIDNGNGTWTIPIGSLSSLAIKPPADFSGDATFTVVAVSTEREGDSNITTATGHIHVNPVADAPVISASLQSGSEDQPLALNLGISLKDSDGSEHISAVTLSGLPSGALLTHATDNHDGTWSIAPADIGIVQLVPPSNWSGDATLTVTATSQEGLSGPQASTTAQIPLHISAVADTPTASATDSTGVSGAAIGLHLSAALTDTDGSEHLSAVISGLPDGAHLSAGLHNGDGSWTLTLDQLSNVSVTAPSSGDLHLSLDVFAQESSNAQVATAHQEFTVHVSEAAPSSDLEHAFHTPPSG